MEVKLGLYIALTLKITAIKAFDFREVNILIYSDKASYMYGAFAITCFEIIVANGPTDFLEPDLFQAH